VQASCVGASGITWTTAMLSAVSGNIIHSSGTSTRTKGHDNTTIASRVSVCMYVCMYVCVCG